MDKQMMWDAAAVIMGTEVIDWRGRTGMVIDTPDELVEVMQAIASAAPACAWIIERQGHLPTLTHYESVADTWRAHGAAVTPYVSQY